MTVMSMIKTWFDTSRTIAIFKIVYTHRHSANNHQLEHAIFFDKDPYSKECSPDQTFSKYDQVT